MKKEEDHLLHIDETNWLLKTMFNAFVLFDSVFDESGKFVSYRFVFINDAYEKITGVKNEDVKGKTVHEVWPGTEQSWVDKYGHVAITGETLEFDNYHDPTKKLYHCIVYRPWDYQERFCVIFDDITENKLAEKEILQQHYNLISLIENSSDLIWSIDEDYKLLTANSNFLNFMKPVFNRIIKPGDLVISKDLIPEELYRKWKKFYDKALAGNKFIETIKTSFQRDRDFYFEFRYNPIFNENTEVTGVSIIGRDITEAKHYESALIESENKFRSITEQMSNMIYLTDEKGIITYISPASENIFGYKPEEMEGRSFVEFLAEENISKAMQKFKSAISSGQTSKNLELLMRHKDGTTFHGEVSGKLYFQGDQHGTIGVIRDISERVNSHLKIKESEKKYRSLFNNINSGIALHEIILDDSGKPVDFTFLDVSPTWELQTGLNREDVIGKRGLEIIPNLEQKWIDVYGKVALTGESISFVDHSEYLDKYWGVKAYCPCQGQFAVAMNDVTDRIKTENELAAKEQCYRTLLENVVAGIGYYDLEGTVILFNKMAADLMNGKPEDFIGKSIYDLYGNEFGKLYHNRIKATAKADDFLDFEDKVELPAGTKWFNSKYNKIFNEKDELIGVQIISTDITEMKENQSELEKLNFTLEAAQKMAKLGYWRYDIEAQQPKWSDHMFEITGFKKENGAPTYEGHKKPWHPDDWEIFDKAVKDCIAGTPYNIITRIWHENDNSYHYIQTQGFPVIEKNGEINQLFGTSQDITEMKKAEAEIIRAKETAEQYLELAGNIILSINTNGEIILINQAGLELLGYDDKDELIGKNWFETSIPLNLIDERKEAFHKALSGQLNIVDHYEAEIITKTGKVKTISWHNTSIRNEAGQIIAILSSGTDVTEIKSIQKDLEDSKERFELAMKSTSDGIFDWNLITSEIYYSPGWKSMLGYKYDELPNEFSVWEKLTAPEDVKLALKMLKELTNKQRDNFEIEFKMKHKDGHWVDILSRANAYFDKSGTAIRLVGTHIDISERKKIERTLISSEARYRNLVDSASDPIYLMDETGFIIDTNKSACQLLGYSKEEIIGAPIDKVDPNYPISEFNKFWSDVPFKKQLIFETTHQRKDKTLIPIEISSSKYKIADKIYYYGIARDITERKRAENALIASEAKYKLYFEHAPVGYQSLDINGCFLDINEAWLNILGYKREEVLGKWFGDFLHPNQKEIFRKLFPQNIQSREIIRNIEFHLRQKSGSYIIADYTAKIGRDENDNFTRTHCIFRDITKSKKVQQELIENKDKLQSLFDNMSSGFAYHKIILDDSGKPVDYEFLEINKAFEEMAGIRADRAVGKKVTSVFQGIEKDPADWIGVYGNVALTGESVHFESYRKNLNKWFSVSAYSPARGYFATVFEDITAQKMIEHEL